MINNMHIDCDNPSRNELMAEIIRTMKKQAEGMQELYEKSFNFNDELANGRRFFGPMPQPFHAGVFEMQHFKELVDLCLDTIIKDNQRDYGTAEEIAFQLLRDHYYPEWEGYRNYE